mmetsp:Transcript_14431/g.14954  ORF Transcript_14431/g.14954 Transcript_14431/m.14954 type:complete len:162 (+) Transcript_14431:3-488(+)
MIDSQCPLGCGISFSYLKEDYEENHKEIDFHFNFICRKAKMYNLNNYSVCLSEGIQLVHNKDIDTHCESCRRKNLEFNETMLIINQEKKDDNLNINSALKRGMNESDIFNDTMICNTETLHSKNQQKKEQGAFAKVDDNESMVLNTNAHIEEFEDSMIQIH